MTTEPVQAALGISLYDPDKRAFASQDELARGLAAASPRGCPPHG
ncbi:hypothetical protein [Streptomyces coffeae]|nr:hypothetical protein [Streptomyces coffeae]